ncbi:unnamed protein product [Candidula unifasciata]|uniref:Tetratricopeptide SHNi-TPR domain-containing protein n=1 Tax=Candidula unifasciata TaxID=100452 RepID=A0A8S3ZK78_9EUPU|nr:unnamed protein product [Candidula unifasciata]
MATEAASASSSASESSEKSEAIKKASELLAQGKRNMVCGEIPKAVSFYEEAVQLLVKSCGELSRDCADAYYSCGSALLELGRMETSVLGAALDGADTQPGDGSEVDKTETDASEVSKQKTVVDKDISQETMEGVESTVTAAASKEEESGSAEPGNKSADDVPNFQLSWEYLDLAKVIYLKSDAAADQLKAAECYIRLGELSMETEQHATAAEDLENALKIQQKLLPADDRLIAETHYQLGLAYGLGKEFELAIKHYTEAIGVIEAKIVSLSKLVEEAAADDDDKEKLESDQVKKYQDEIKELQELLPEMKNKIEDSREEAKDMEKMKNMAKELLGFSGSSTKFGSPTKKSEPPASDKSAEVDENGQRKATDIAHLVRKKRKPDNDEPPVSNGQESKKIKQGDSSRETSTDVKTSSRMDASGSDDKLDAEQNVATASD